MKILHLYTERQELPGQKFHYQSQSELLASVILFQGGMIKHLGEWYRERVARLRRFRIEKFTSREDPLSLGLEALENADFGGVGFSGPALLLCLWCSNILWDSTMPCKHCPIEQGSTRDLITPTACWCVRQRMSVQAVFCHLCVVVE